MQLVGISVSNLKEISSKEQLMLYVCFLLVFSIAEFFDEDISDILIAHSKIKTKTNSFYA
ncbi:hypothetical protein FNE05_06865 [Helicobacter pylori]|nr:hypothetical protein FNE05_06865 [Helicobacter pylori]